MKKNELLTEDKVKEILNITDFRSLSKDKIVEFVSLIPKMSKEVALAIISKFPDYADMAISMVKSLSLTCDKAISEATGTTKEVIASYQEVLKSLEKQLNDKSLTAKNKDRINKQMIEIVDKMALHDNEHKTFLKSIAKYKGAIVGVAIAAGAAILGVSLSNKE